MKRTNTCGELNKKDIKKEAALCGWINSRRDHGGIIFIDLRDRHGITQIVFDPKKKDLFKEASFIVFNRPGYKLKKVPGMKAHFVNKDICHISSTQIREKLKQDKSLKNLLPVSIINYIKKTMCYPHL